jgi:hypothetical protein
VKTKRRIDFTSSISLKPDVKKYWISHMWTIQREQIHVFYLPLSFDVWVTKNISGDQSHEGLTVTGHGRRFEWVNRGSNRQTQKPGTAIPLSETSISMGIAGS